VSTVSISHERSALDVPAEPSDAFTRAAAGLWDSETGLSRWIGFVAVGLIVVTVLLTRPPDEPTSRRALVVGLTLTSAALYVFWLAVGRLSSRPSITVLTAMALTGGLLGGQVAGAAPAFAYMAAFAAARRLPPRVAAAITLTALVTMGGTGWATGRISPLGVLGISVGFAAVMLAGINQSVRLRLHAQAKLLVAEGQILVEERARSAALSERARIAREIHDVMAHSLSGLVVQLEAASLLLARDDDTARRRAAEHVDRARGLARSGLDETRRALQTLRGETLPTADLLGELVNAYRADTGRPGTLRVTGDVRALPADVGLTVYRVAQEALTNTRRHAPGASADVHLDYRPATVALTVSDHRPEAGGSDGGGRSPRPALEHVGGGYGLVGMRERAELLGGELTVGPVDDGWRVDLRVPA
jgi:signal transduction histidine kinase